MQETILWESIFARTHAGPLFALARIQEDIFEELFSEYFCQTLRGIHVSANTGKAPGELFYVSVSGRGVQEISPLREFQEFCAIAVQGLLSVVTPSFRLSENIFEELFSEYICEILGEFISVRIHGVPSFSKQLHV